MVAVKKKTEGRILSTSARQQLKLKNFHFLGTTWRIWAPWRTDKVGHLPMVIVVGPPRPRATWKFSPSKWPFFNSIHGLLKWGWSDVTITTLQVLGDDPPSSNLPKNINGVRSWMGACSVDRTPLAFGIVSFRRPLVPADRTSECARPSMVTWRWGQESAYGGMA